MYGQNMCVKKLCIKKNMCKKICLEKCVGKMCVLKKYVGKICVEKKRQFKKVCVFKKVR